MDHLGCGDVFGGSYDILEEELLGYERRQV